MPNTHKSIPFIIASLFSLHSHAEELNNFDMFVSTDFGRASYSQDLEGANSNLDSNGNTYGIRASGSYQDASNFGGQIDAVYKKYDIGRSKVSNVDLAGHLFYRNDNYLIGGFVQYRNPDVNANINDISANFITNIFDDLLVSEQVFWGAEGQAYFGDVTVGGKLAKQDFVNQRDFSGQRIIDDGWIANIEGKYFINNNWIVDLGYSYNKTKFNNGFGSETSESLKQKSYSIGTEYRLENKPVSFYAQINRNEIKIAGLDFDDNQYLAGIKINFGSTTLKGRDRGGASLDPIAQQPAGAMILGNIFDQDNYGFF